MIFEALQLLRAELTAYLVDSGRDTQVQIELSSPTSNAGQVLLSLVNVEEETTLRNSSPYQRNPTGGYDLVNPPVFLNLYVLISAGGQDSPTTYATALKRLAWVVQCFQQKHVLLPATQAGFASDDPGTARLRLSLDLYSLSFEKLSQLWGTLGGKQQPCVLYKVRVVEEQGEGQLGYGPEITLIERRTTITPLSTN